MNVGIEKLIRKDVFVKITNLRKPYCFSIEERPICTFFIVMSRTSGRPSSTKMDFTVVVNKLYGGFS